MKPVDELVAAMVACLTDVHTVKVVHDVSHACVYRFSISTGIFIGVC